MTLVVFVMIAKHLALLLFFGIIPWSNQSIDPVAMLACYGIILGLFAAMIARPLFMPKKKSNAKRRNLPHRRFAATQARRA